MYVIIFEVVKIMNENLKTIKLIHFYKYRIFISDNNII